MAIEIENFVDCDARRAPPPDREISLAQMKMTRWQNNTDRTLTISLHVSGGESSPYLRGGMPTNMPRRVLKLVFAPGQIIEVPREFDRGIHDVRDGVVVGGLGPHLTRLPDEEGARVPPMHPAFGGATTAPHAAALPDEDDDDEPVAVARANRKAKK